MLNRLDIIICIALAVSAQTSLAQSTMTSKAATTVPTGLVAAIQLSNSKVLVGEPLVVTISLINKGTDLTTGYSSDSVFREHAPIRFVIEQGGARLLEIEGNSSGARVLVPDAKLLRNEELRKRFVLESGGVLRAKKIICLVVSDGEKRVFLHPGKYSISAHVALGGEEIPTDVQAFSVEGLPPEERKLLDLITPSLQSLLEGRWGKPTAEMIQLGEQLRESYPQSRHRIFLDRWLLRAYQEPAKYRIAADEYMKIFPQTPLGDDVLWEWASVERRANRRDEAVRLLDRLVKDYPQSPFVVDAKDSLDRMKPTP